MRQACPNCGSDRPDRYCSRCGQNDRDYMRGLWAVVYEFVREMFELDSRLFRTLKSLLFKPGHLSTEFSRNRRAAYMSPVRLYLFTSFLFFLVLSISAGGWLSNLDLSEEGNTGAVDLDLQQDDSETGIAADGVLADSVLEVVGSAPAVVDSPVADSVLAAVDSVLAVVDSALADRGIAVSALVAGALADRATADRTLADSAAADSALGDVAFADSAQAGREPADSVDALPAAVEPDTAAAVASDTIDADEPEGQAVPPDRLEALKAALRPEHARKVDDILGRPGESLGKQVVVGLASGESEERTGWLGWLVRYSRGLVIDLFHDPDAFLQQAIANLPVAMFFLLPVFAMILAVCYTSKRRYFVEHLVFGMHIHTFVFLTLAVALLVPGETDGNWVKLIFILASPVYVLIALRKFYGDGWGRTLVKAFVVWNLYSFVLFPGILLAFLVRT